MSTTLPRMDLFIAGVGRSGTTMQQAPARIPITYGYSAFT